MPCNLTAHNDIVVSNFLNTLQFNCSLWFCYFQGWILLRQFSWAGKSWPALVSALFLLSYFTFFLVSFFLSVFGLFFLLNENTDKDYGAAAYPGRLGFCSTSCTDKMIRFSSRNVRFPVEQFIRTYENKKSMEVTSWGHIWNQTWRIGFLV